MKQNHIHARVPHHKIYLWYYNLYKLSQIKTINERFASLPVTILCVKEAGTTRIRCLNENFGTVVLLDSTISVCLKKARFSKM